MRSDRSSYIHCIKYCSFFKNGASTCIRSYCDEHDDFYPRSFTGIPLNVSVAFKGNRAMENDFLDILTDQGFSLKHTDIYVRKPKRPPTSIPSHTDEQVRICIINLGKTPLEIQFYTSINITLSESELITFSGDPPHSVLNPTVCDRLVIHSPVKTFTVNPSQCSKL